MNVLDQAAQFVEGEKQKKYGHPRVNWRRTAAMWSVILDTDVAPAQAVLCMIALKLAREVHCAQRDNLVDIAGYARVCEMLDEV